MNDRRTALITGGTKRIGRAIALKMAEKGFDVAVTYLTSEAEADEMRSRGIQAIRADCFQPDDAAATIFDQFRFDNLDVLVNNASAYLPGKLNETTVELVRKLNAIHVETPLLLCKRFEKRLRQSHGCVVNMVDLLAEKPWPDYLAYCTSKAALANLTVGLAKELAPDVTVNGIAPGVVDWPDNYPDREKEKYLQRVPLACAGTPDDVAKLVHFLCTDGKYITGQIIHLDGGRSIT